MVVATHEEMQCLRGRGDNDPLGSSRDRTPYRNTGKGPDVQMSHVTSDVTPRSAFLEFGSTSIKFYLVESRGTGGQIVEEVKVPWEMGYDVFQHSRIAPSTMAKCTSALRELQARFRNVSLRNATAIGTAALREAQNSDLFQRVIREELGLRLSIVPGGIEAFLLETGFRPLVESFPTGVFDLGGGSLEFVEFLAPHSTKKSSLPLGAIRLHCQIRSARDLFAYIYTGRKEAARLLREYLPVVDMHYGELIGTGGTVRTIGELLDADTFTMEDIIGLLDREVRGRVWSEVSAHRRKVLLPGLLVVESLLATLKLKHIVYRSQAVKHGLIHVTNLIPSGTPSRSDAEL